MAGLAAATAAVLLSPDFTGLAGFLGRLQKKSRMTFSVVYHPPKGPSFGVICEANYGLYC